MFTTFLETISGYFNKRFILSAFFPALAFGGLNLLVYINFQGSTDSIDIWLALPLQWQIFLSVFFFGILLFIAYLLESFSVSLTRLYEGYWENVPLLKSLARSRRKFYQTCWDYLKAEFKWFEEQIAPLEEKDQDPLSGETSEEKNSRKVKLDRFYAELSLYEREWFLFYPARRALVMPTKLGNILRAAEMYPSLRYNADAVVTWPRLQSLLPEEFASGLKDAKASFDLLLNLTTLTIIFTVFWQIFLVIATHRWDLFLIVSLGWVVVYITCQAALNAARTYAELIKSAYDLHRWKLIDQLHLKQPTSLKEEQDLWGDITDLLYRNYPPNQAAYSYTTFKKPTVNDKKSKLDELRDWWFGKEAS